MFENKQDIMEDIVPYKAYASNNLDSMHHYLIQTIKNTNQMCDLLPFLNSLINLNELKKTLETTLNKQYDMDKSQELRSLFFRIMGFQIIPSDVHAKIVSFLPCSEYKKLPVVSTHFRNIMRNYPWIFNEKGYSLKLEFTMSNYGLDTGTRIVVHHEDKVIGVHAYMKGITNFTQSTIQLDKITSWRIGFQNWYSKDEDTSKQLADKHNKLLLQFIHKFNNYPQKVTFEVINQDRNINIISHIMKNCSFKQCIMLESSLSGYNHHSRTFPLFDTNVNIFNNVEYLFVNCCGNDNINKILKLSKVLKCVEVNIPMNGCKSGCTSQIKVPASVEWLRYKVCQGASISVDISRCNKLIGVWFESDQNLFNATPPIIIWPNQYKIPHAYLQDRQDRYWENLILHDDLVEHIQFVSLAKHAETCFGALEYNNNDEIQKCKIYDYLYKTNDMQNTYVLDEHEINNNLFQKILFYKIKNHKLVKNKIEQIMRWWNANCGLWMIQCYYWDKGLNEY